MKKNPKKCMTSELLFQHIILKEDDNGEYIKEYKRRLDMLELTDQQVKDFRGYDEGRINKGLTSLDKSVLLGTMPEEAFESPFIVDNHTFSENLYYINSIISDRIYFRIWNEYMDFDKVCEKAYEKSEIHSLNGLLVMNVGMTATQQGIFLKNEFRILGKLWYHLDGSWLGEEAWQI